MPVVGLLYNRTMARDASLRVYSEDPIRLSSFSQHLSVVIFPTNSSGTLTHVFQGPPLLSHVNWTGNSLWTSADFMLTKFGLRGPLTSFVHQGFQFRPCGSQTSQSQYSLEGWVFTLPGAVQVNGIGVYSLMPLVLQIHISGKQSMSISALAELSLCAHSDNLSNTFKWAFLLHLLPCP